MAYLGITLRAPKAEVTQREVVTAGFVILLEIDQRDSQFVIVADEEVIPPACGLPRFTTNSDIAVRVLGLRVGNSFKWSDTPSGERRAVIKEVLSPETFAFRYAMEQAARSAGRAPVTKIQVGENPLESMEPILRKQREERDRIVEQIVGRPVPIAMMARALHKGMHEVWRQLTKGALHLGTHSWVHGDVLGESRRRDGAREGDWHCRADDQCRTRPAAEPSSGA